MFFMNNKFYFDNIFLIDTCDNLTKIINIINENKKNLVILNLESKNLEKTLKKFSNIKYFDYVDKKIIFGSVINLYLVNYMIT